MNERLADSVAAVQLIQSFREPLCDHTHVDQPSPPVLGRVDRRSGVGGHKLVEVAAALVRTDLELEGRRGTGGTGGACEEDGACFLLRRLA